MTVTVAFCAGEVLLRAGASGRAVRDSALRGEEESAGGSWVASLCLQLCWNDQDKVTMRTLHFIAWDAQWGGVRPLACANRWQLSLC